MSCHDLRMWMATRALTDENVFSSIIQPAATVTPYGGVTVMAA
jgi:hypothetical protein